MYLCAMGIDIKISMASLAPFEKWSYEKATFLIKQKLKILSRNSFKLLIWYPGDIFAIPRLGL